MQHNKRNTTLLCICVSVLRSVALAALQVPELHYVEDLRSRLPEQLEHVRDSRSSCMRCNAAQRIHTCVVIVMVALWEAACSHPRQPGVAVEGAELDARESGGERARRAAA
jgi:hypothetical protein